MGQQSDLFDCRYRSVYEVYTYLAANTTVRPTVPELVERGWIPLIQAGLVGVSTSGYLVWTGATAGGRNVAELNSASIMSNINYGTRLALSGGLMGSTNPALGTPAENAMHKLGLVTVTLDGAGAYADLSMVPSVAGYTGLMKFLGIWSLTSEAGVVISPQCPAGTAGAPSAIAMPTTSNQLIRTNDGLVIKGPNTIASGTDDGDAIVFDIAGGGAAQVVVFEFEYWYET